MRHPLIILGLDGATFDVLDPLFARGELPHLNRLATTGLRTELWSTDPPVTLPAWTSFLTGLPPSRHGVTDIFTHAHGNYLPLPATGHLRRAPTFLRELSARGLRVAALGVPGTFPPEPLNGICVSGFDAPGAAQATPPCVFPTGLYPTLAQLGGWRYATFNEFAPGADRAARATRALLADVARKERIVLRLFAQERWDVFFVHLQASDTAGHHLWHTFDPNSPRARALSDALPSVYKRLDTLIGRLIELAPDETRVLVVSDHGMGGASDVAVHLNRWLHSRGYLTFAGAPSTLMRRALGAAPPQALGALLHGLPDRIVARLGSMSRGASVDFSRTLAFSDEIDCSPSIWINRRYHFPQGKVEQRAADNLVATMRDALMTAEDASGRPLFARIITRSEHADGPHRNDLPDLVLEPHWHDGYRPCFLASPGPGPWLRRIEAHEHTAGKGFGMPGAHRRQGVFIASGPGLPAMDLPILFIEQAGAYVYSLLGDPLPAHLDAPPDFLPGVVGARSQAHAVAELPQPYTAAQALTVGQHLSALGYL